MQAQATATRIYGRADSQQWVTINAAAECMGVSPKTIRRRIADGSLPAWRVGPRLIRVNLADVEHVLLRRIPVVSRRCA